MPPRSVKTPESVGEDIKAANAAWTFAGDVANAFPEHVRRSIPLYEAGHDLVCQLSDTFVRPDSLAYEIGTSVGELLEKLLAHNSNKPKARWIGLDAEASMISKAKERLAGVKNVTLEVADVTQYDLQPTDFVVSYYCIQFIPPRLRQDVLDRIYSALNWGGALVLFEKVRAPDARFQDICSSLYLDYKLSKNYTPDQIVAKARSLKGVLEPFSTQGNLDLLRRAGFQDVMTVQKMICFEGFLAIK